MHGIKMVIMFISKLLDFRWFFFSSYFSSFCKCPIMNTYYCENHTLSFFPNHQKSESYLLKIPLKILLSQHASVKEKITEFHYWRKYLKPFLILPLTSISKSTTMCWLRRYLRHCLFWVCCIPFHKLNKARVGDFNSLQGNVIL